MESPEPLTLWTPPTDVVVARHAFRTATVEMEMPAGRTLAEIIEATGLPPWTRPRVWVGDWEILPAYWATTRPRAGRRVFVRAVATGGGGDSNKGWRIALMVVIAIAAVVVSALTYGALTPIVGTIAAGVIGGLAGAVISIGGALLVNALLPPPKPKLADLTGFGALGATYSLTGTRNQLAPYQAVPRVYGRHRLYPPLAAFPNTSLSGTDQVLTQLFTLGYGPLVIEDMKIGETPIDEFSGVEIEVRPGAPDDLPMTTMPFAQFEEPLSIDLTPVDPPQTGSIPGRDYGPPAVRSTRPDVDAISIEVAFPRGLFRIDEDNDKHTFQAWVDIAIRHFGTTDPFVPVYYWEFIEARIEPLRFTFQFGVTRGQYDVRLQAAIPPDWGPWVGEQPNPVVVFDVAWTALRSWQDIDPAPLKNMAKIGLKIQASGQLSGVVDQFNCIATSILWMATRVPASRARPVRAGTGATAI